MTARITDSRGVTLTGEIRCWMGRRVVEIDAMKERGLAPRGLTE
jgi:hypothetical protein